MMTADFIIIGGGMAGVSAAAALARDGRVILIEQERHLGYHSTGRSAAIFADSYGDDVIQALSRYSRPILAGGDVASPLLTPRGILHLIRAGEPFPDPADRRTRYPHLSTREVLDLIPSMRPEAISGAYLEGTASDIDVHALQTEYVRQLRAQGGTVVSGHAVDGARRRDGVWEVDVGDATITAPVVVNAAGAWAARVGSIFGASDPGLWPTRRSAALVTPPEGVDVGGWPMAVPFDGTVYWKPEGDKLMVSPAEEVASDPHDAFCDDMDLAEGIDRFECFMRWSVTRVEASWAGLRTLTLDGRPIVGADPQVEGLYWLAGQGGYGIQTAPATSEMLAAAVLGRVPKDELAAAAAACAPRRTASYSRVKSTGG